jgi:hypothetical protein
MSLNSEIGSPVRTDNTITARYPTACDEQHEMGVELNKVWNSYMVFTIEQSILSPQVSRKHNPSPDTEMETGSQIISLILSGLMSIMTLMLCSDLLRGSTQVREVRFVHLYIGVV